MPYYTSKRTSPPARGAHRGLFKQASASLVVLAALSACAPAPAGDQTAAIKTATAAALPDVPADQFVISDFSRGAAKSTWKVTAAGKTYACDADELLRIPSCKAEA